MIRDTITQKIADALKAHDEIRLSTLRMLSSAFNYEKIAKQHELSEDEELNVVKKEAKKRTDAIDALKAAQGKQTTASPQEISDRIVKEQTELSILKEYLPEEMNDEELSKLVNEAIDEYKKDLPADATHQSLQAGMGKVIGAVKAKAGMRADGAKIAALVKSKLSV